MTENVWYYYDGEKQFGPVGDDKLKTLICSGHVTPEYYVFGAGFDDWRPLTEVEDLAKLAPQISGRRPAAERAPIVEVVIAHNGRNIASGTLCNISVSGVFFQTKDMVFDVGEEVKLTLKEGAELGKPIHLHCRVARHSPTRHPSVGYGLEILDLDEDTQRRIYEYIQRRKKAS